MFTKAFLLTVLAAFASSVANAQDGIGDSLWRTFGHTKELPITVEKALSSGFKKVGDCDKNLGILYAQSSKGATEDHPLGLYFTAAGQIAGVQGNVWGKNDVVGNAAQDNLIQKGYWKPSAKNESWSLSVSFRGADAMCSEEKSPLVMGDRVVINQDGIARALPLSEDAAKGENYYRGSCMQNMGTHYFYDLKSAPVSSWEEDQVQPIVPMFHPETKKLHAFFFTSPVVQKGSYDLLFASHDWEAPFLTPKNMCQNWCDDACTWKTKAWSTMHIFLHSSWEDLKCPGGSGIVGRSCKF